MPEPRVNSRWSGLRKLVPVATTFAVLFAVSWLPPDSSRAEVDKSGRINVCMPASYPPLVTGAAGQPGFEVEVLRRIADANGWRTNIVSNTAMGRDFNPRAWRITRAQCQIVAGGVVVNNTTSSFLSTAVPHLATGWALVGKPGVTLDTITGPVAMLATTTGLDRIGLGQYLRERGVKISVVRDAAALKRGVVSGQFEAGITEALLAQSVFDDTDLDVEMIGPPMQKFPLGLAFWKGDLTLQRSVEATMSRMWSEGTMGTIAEAYGLDADVLCPEGKGACSDL